MRRSALGPSAVALLSIAQVAIAQLPVLGTPIRVESSAIVGQRATGSLAAVNSGLITVALGRTGATLVVPWSRTHSVNIGMGRDAQMGGKKGLLTGLGAALIVFPAMTQRSNEGSMEQRESSIGPALIAAALPLGGYLIGRLSAPERWEALAWRPAQDTVLLEGEEPQLLIAPGTKVRVRQERRWFGGTVLDSSGDSLRLQGSVVPMSIAWSNISQINMRDGRSRSRGAALGFVTMGAASLVQLFSGDKKTLRQKQRIIGTNLAIGSTVGALIGRPVWSRVPLPAR